MKHIPNIITCLNLFSGCLACVMASQGSFLGAFIFIIIAAIFDFLDGFAARMLKAYSDIGKELDSLADVVSFGLAPGLLVFTFLQQTEISFPIGIKLSFLAFLIPVFSALRLAKFNLDSRQTTSFIGLPVPANALFWSALIPAIRYYSSGKELLFSVCVFALILLFCFLMISEIPMFSLKFKNYGWKGNEQRYILIIATILTILLFHLFGVFLLLGISLSICIYILLSIFCKSSTHTIFKGS